MIPQQQQQQQVVVVVVVVVVAVAVVVMVMAAAAAAAVAVVAAGAAAATAPARTTGAAAAAVVAPAAPATTRTISRRPSRFRDGADAQVGNAPMPKSRRDIILEEHNLHRLMQIVHEEEEERVEISELEDGCGRTALPAPRSTRC